MSMDQNPFQNGGNNPFQAPTARVADVSADSGIFVPEGKVVPAGNGMAWISGGWQLFTQNPGTWIGMSVIFIIIFMVMGIVPFIGPMAANLLMPVFLGGILLGCKALEDGDSLTINHLFAGFSGPVGNLVMIGLIYLVGVVAVALVMGIVAVIFGAGAAFLGGKVMALVPILIAALLAMLLIIPLAMAVWFAPALVIFHQVPPFEAMKSSFVVCIKNFLPFLVYGLVAFVLMIIALIPLGLGLLVLSPVLMASMYVGYKDMFLRS